VLHDVGDHEGQMFLVMEHLAGQTLAERLERGRLPLEQALTVATELAEALSAAHRQGVIHRDLKPANVMLTKSGAKLLDFGLAKLTGRGEQPAASYAGSSVPTQAATLTGQGVIVGTLQYMAPEQLEGKPPDARTDLWALGAILYEMVTGKRAFEGTSAVSLIGSIMNAEPVAVTTLQPLAPAGLDRLVTACLQKDPPERLQAARDVVFVLESLATTPAAAAVPRPGWRRALVLTSVLVVALVAAWLVGYFGRPETGRDERRPVRSNLMVAETPGLTSPDDVAISPDGGTVAFRATDGTRSRLYVRRLDDWSAKPLEGTEDVLGACFSPEGDSIAFMSRTGLFRVKLAGGPPVSIFKDQFPFNVGMEWGADGYILFARGSRIPGIWRVHVATGQVSLVLEPASPGIIYYWPRRLPESDVITFVRLEQGKQSIVMLRPGASAPDVIVPDGTRPRYIPAIGHLVYQAEGHLLAVRFDPRQSALGGDPSVVVRDVGNTFPMAGEYDVSAEGTLVYLPPARAGLSWRPRHGAGKRVAFEKVGAIDSVRLSPDARRAVLGVATGPAHQLWLAEALDAEPVLTRLTPGNWDWLGAFTRDGKRLLFTSPDIDNRFNIYAWTLDSSAGATRQTSTPNTRGVTSVGPGDVFLFQDGREQFDVWQQELDRSATARRLIDSPGGNANATFSPDGQWIAYDSNLGGRQEVYVMRYPDGPARVVSVDGGGYPVWSPAGSEVFYQKSTSVFAVRVANGARVGPAMHLFDRPDVRDRNWDAAAPDAARFLVAEAIRPSHVNIVTNWFEELKAKVPAGGAK
jgi:serine/threonine-protein kinase